jgi:hypothetical protein
VLSVIADKAGLPDNLPKWGKIYQITATLPNGHKIYQIHSLSTYISNDPKIYQHFPFKGPSKCTQFGILGLKIHHLATLRQSG